MNAISRKLYNHGLVIADVHSETDDECSDRLTQLIGKLTGVFQISRIPHMQANDHPGEISLSVLSEQGSDLLVLEGNIKNLPGVTYTDFTPDPCYG